jgi:hypothetical protein
VRPGRRPRGPLIASAAALAALAAGCGSAAPPSPGPAAAEAPSAPAVPVAAPARGAAPARSEPFALVPDAEGDAAAVVARPGARGGVGLRLANGADRARTFALSADAAWVSAPAAVTVPPRQSIAVTAVVAVPADAPAGVLSARVTARPAEQAGAPLAVDYASSVPLRVRVAP